jgi:hypothetical protein
MDLEMPKRLIIWDGGSITLSKYHIKSILLEDRDKIIKTQWKLEPTPLATCHSIDTMHRKKCNAI